MKKNIETLEDLQSEITRIEQIKALKELKLRDDIKNFSQQLRPANLIKNAFKSFSSDSDLKNTVTARGLEAGLGLLITNLLFKNSNPVFRSIAAIIGTAAAAKIFGEDSPKYIEKIKQLFDKIKNRNKDSGSVFDEEDIYNPL